MSWFAGLISSSIGKKQLMALTGLLLCGFLSTHLAGNYLLLVGRDAFNAYAETLTSNKLFLYTAETILFSIFAVHIGLACKLTLQNRAARPVRYAVRGSRGNSSFASRNMFVTGLIVLVFLVLHLIHFRLADTSTATLYDIVEERFRSIPYVVYYVFSSCVLGIHLWHGFQSAFRSLGIEHPKYTPILVCLGRLFAVVCAIGYSVLPVFMYFQESGA